MKINHLPGVPGLRHEHREDATQDRECRGILVPQVRVQKSRASFLERYHEPFDKLRAGKRRKLLSPPPRCISPGNRGVYFLHMYSCGKINATFYFPALRSFSVGGSARWYYLCASVPQAWYPRRVVNPNSPIQGCLRLTRIRACGTTVPIEG